MVLLMRDVNASVTQSSADANIRTAVYLYFLISSLLLYDFYICNLLSLL